MQPTSPLLKVESLDQAIDRIIKSPAIDTIISAHDTTALSWSNHNGSFAPLYEKRLNRQYLKPTYTETGGFLLVDEALLQKTIE